MALSAEEKAKIRAYLGYADSFRYKNTRLEGMLEGALSAEAETLVRAHLTELTRVDTELTAAISTGGLKKADEIEFYPSSETRTQEDSKRNEGRMYINRLSIALAVPVFGDFYGSAGYPGDAFSQDGIAPNRGGTSGGAFGIG
jgi:hypothetical protein